MSGGRLIKTVICLLLCSPIYAKNSPVCIKYCMRDLQSRHLPLFVRVQLCQVICMRKSSKPTAQPTFAPTTTSPTQSPSAPPTPAGCFAKGSSIKKEQFDHHLNQTSLISVNIEDLRIGDKVECVSFRTFQKSTCKVTWHLHGFDSNEKLNLDNYRKVKFTDGDAPLILSYHHLVPVLTNFSGSVGTVMQTLPFDEISFLKAIDLDVGMPIITSNASSKTFVVQYVESNSQITADWGYAPLVDDGALLVVNDVIASSFVDGFHGGQTDGSLQHHFAVARYAPVSESITENSEMWGLRNDETWKSFRQRNHGRSTGSNWLTEKFPALSQALKGPPCANPKELLEQCRKRHIAGIANTEQTLVEDLKQSCSSPFV